MEAYTFSLSLRTDETLYVMTLQINMSSLSTNEKQKKKKAKGSKFFSLTLKQQHELTLLWEEKKGTHLYLLLTVDLTLLKGL